MYDTLRLEDQDGIATVTIHRPDKLNALNARVLAELTDVVRRLADANTRVAILTGSGKAFVAGADIAEMSEMSPLEAQAFSHRGHQLAADLEAAPYPVIAAVNGFALGGGCELALCCDFIYAAERAKLGLPEVGLGLMPGFGGTQRLARRVGLGRARELIYSGAMLDAPEALRIGLVNAVVPDGELLDRVRGVAASIRDKAPAAVTSCKRVIGRSLDSDLATGCALEAAAFGALFGSEDQREGTRAFLEKRAPVFKGR